MMKKINTLILTMLLAFPGVGTAMANDSLKSNTDIFLQTNTVNDFQVYMNKRARNFLKKNSSDWVTFNKVVCLYNESQGKFQKLSDSDKKAFLASAEKIQAKLIGMKSTEAESWMKKVEATENVINFLWSIKIEYRPLKGSIETPSILIIPAIGR